jgi:hypothetical protein
VISRYTVRTPSVVISGTSTITAGSLYRWRCRRHEPRTTNLTVPARAFVAGEHRDRPARANLAPTVGAPRHSDSQPDPVSDHAADHDPELRIDRATGHGEDDLAVRGTGDAVDQADLAGCGSIKRRPAPVDVASARCPNRCADMESPRGAGGAGRKRTLGGCSRGQRLARAGAASGDRADRDQGCMRSLE